MKRVAIVLSSQYGQTVKIAERMAERLRTEGLQAQVFRLEDKHAPEVELARFDAAIVGGPVYISKLPSRLIEWTRQHARELNAMPTALFSVSLNAAAKAETAQRENQRILDGFLALTGLQTQRTASLIGAVHYRKYGFLKRWLLRRICAANGGPTDTSRDHELTDWGQVAEFVDSFRRAIGSEAKPLTLA